MLPPFDPKTGALPPGVHRASWPEVVARLGWNAARRELLERLCAVARHLAEAGCRSFYVGGSLATTKAEPKDFDACCTTEGVDHARVDDRFKQGIEAMRRAFGGEVQVCDRLATPDLTYLDYFQIDDRLRIGKGIIDLDLDSLPPAGSTIGATLP